MDIVLANALSAQIVTIFHALEIVHPIGNIRLLTGLGEITFDSKTFVGRDPSCGGLAAVVASTDQTGDTAPKLQLTIHQASQVAAIEMAAADAQGSPVTLWCGAVDQTTMTVVGEPYVLFSGALDLVTLINDGPRTCVTFDIVSAFEYFFTDDQGSMLSDAFHESIWPGELGFEYVTDLTLNMPFGVAGALPALAVSIH